MFAGIGGFREGLRRAGGFECVGHCEQDEHAERSYRALFDTRGEWFCEDIRKADAGSMPDFELLCGGFPCQSFSIAGSRHGFADPRGTLFFELARVAETRKPQYLLFENVPGLPEFCCCLLPGTEMPVLVRYGERSYVPLEVREPGERAEETAGRLNRQLGVTKQQQAAMLWGSMFGWDIPAADPARYDEQGMPKRHGPKHEDRQR